MPVWQDLSGQPFGRLLVLSYAGQSRWWCQCVCGEKRRVQTSHLKSSHTTSCGCFHKEIVAEQGHKNGVHGLSHTPIYRLWAGMHQRCYDPGCRNYKRYGARGIVVCECWHTFEHFFADMGLRPKDCTLDRYPDKNGPYAPENCRWATHKEQQRNRRNNIPVTFNGQTMIISEWAEALGIKFVTLWWRLDNWSVERALSTLVPPMKK